MLSDRGARIASSCSASVLALVVAALAGLAGCAQRPDRAAQVAGPPATTAALRLEAPRGRRVFELDAERSVLRVLVHRAGPLAKFGHDHVLRATALTGRAWLGQDDGWAGAGFELAVPVAGFVVDAAADRAAVGGEFAGDVPEAARAGTYRNLLGPAVLDAAAHPYVRVRSVGDEGPATPGLWRVALSLRGTTIELEVPVQLEREADRVQAHGVLRLRQGELGIVPFSIAGGAVAVADELELRFELHFDAKGRT